MQINQTDMKLEVHYPDGAGATTFLNSDPFSFVIDASSAIPGYGTRQSAQITFSGGEFIPFGVRTVEVLCSSGDAFKGGSCDSTHNTFVSLSFIPNAQSSELHLTWDIQ